MKLMVDEIAKNLNISISLSTLKRLIKSLGFVWKRVRKSLKNKRDQADFDKAQSEIENMIELAKLGQIDLYYFDGSGLGLTPNIPYAWQEKNTTIELETSRSKNINVLGFMSAAGEKLSSYCFEDSVNSDVIIACFNSFIKSLDPSKRTFVVLDNASTHRCKAFKAMIESWEEQGLYLYFIPPYSPELNRIEILWRFIKYKWMPFDSTSSIEKLRENLYYVLKNIGSEYKVTFG
jgi:transposase